MPEEPWPEFELVPDDGEDLTVDEELEQFVDPDVLPEVEENLEANAEPIGRGLLFDNGTGIFGANALWTHGITSVVQIAAIALRTKRGEHLIFSDQFGMDEPEALIGYMDDAHRVAIYERDVTDTLLSCHERITNITNFEYVNEANQDTAYVNVTIEIDGDDQAIIEQIPLGEVE